MITTKFKLCNTSKSEHNGGIASIFQLSKIVLMAIFFSISLVSCDKDEEVPATGPKTDLSVAIEVDTRYPAVGSVINMNITANNNGNSNVEDVFVKCPLPEGTELVSAVPSVGYYMPETGIWNVGKMNRNTSLKLNIKVKVTSYGYLACVAKIGGHVTETYAQNDSLSLRLETPLSGLTQEKGWACEVFSAMKDIYLWNTSLPNALNLTQYPDAGKALDYLSSLKADPVTGEPIDRYSFLDEVGGLSGEIQEGVSSGDLGFMVKAALSGINSQVSFYVNYVYSKSPAGLAGVQRSYEVVKINGSDEVHPGLTTDGYLDTQSAGYKNMVNGLYSSVNVSFTFKKPDGSLLDVTLSPKEYTINSVLCDTVYNIGGKSVGYLVFNSFLGESSVEELSTSIRKFENVGARYIIVDLRYNGGGSVSTCAELSNMLAPYSANDRPMFTYKMNSIMTKYYQSQNVGFTNSFSKKNTLQPTKLYFIVGYNTASAAELLINNLRPYYPGNLFLIGRTTYGKPCGFWSTPIGYSEEQTAPKVGYDLYAVSFETVNANNEGGYYQGMAPGTSKYPGIVASDALLPWGDTNDGCLSQAINHIGNGTFKVQQKASASRIRAAKIDEFNPIDKRFKGMIDFRKQSVK